MGDLLASTGAEVSFGEPVAGDLDAIYTFDPVLVADAGVIALRPGKELRRPEAAATVDDLARLGIPVAAAFAAPATAEGGDLLWLDEQTLLAGRGYRTNAAGSRRAAARSRESTSSSSTCLTTTGPPRSCTCCR